MYWSSLKNTPILRKHNALSWTLHSLKRFRLQKKNTIFEKLKKYAALFQLPADNQSNATAEQILGLKKMISHRVFKHHTIVRKYVWSQKWGILKMTTHLRIRHTDMWGGGGGGGEGEEKEGRRKKKKKEEEEEKEEEEKEEVGEGKRKKKRKKRKKKKNLSCYSTHHNTIS